MKKGDKFSGRPSNQILDLVTEQSGVVTVDYGSSWKTLRKFGLMTLRGYDHSLLAVNYLKCIIITRTIFYWKMSNIRGHYKPVPVASNTESTT